MSRFIQLGHPIESPWNFELEQLVSNCATPCVWSAYRETGNRLQDPSCSVGADAVFVADWQATDVPPKYCGQKRLLFQMEAPLLTVSNIPELHLKHYYDGISTYRLDSDVPNPYFPYRGDAIAQGLLTPPVPFDEKRKDAIVVMVRHQCRSSM